MEASPETIMAAGWLAQKPFWGQLSSSRAPLLAPSPLRTGLEGFPFIRLEHPKTPP